MECTICNSEIYGRYLTGACLQTICAGHSVEYCFSCGSFVNLINSHLLDGCFNAYCSSSVMTHFLRVERGEKRVLQKLVFQKVYNN